MVGLADVRLEVGEHRRDHTRNVFRSDWGGLAAGRSPE